MEKWFNSNILLVSQLFHDEGVLLSYEDFLILYNVPITPREYAIVFDAIPSGTLMLFKGIPWPHLHELPSLNPFDSLVGEMCFSLLPKNNNKSIRALFQKNVVSIPYVHTYWNMFVYNLYWRKEIGRASCRERV